MAWAAALDAGADASAADECGQTPLHWAAHQGSEAVAQLLLGAGALFGGLALLVWAVVLHGRMAAAFLGADGAAAAAARLGTGFWCCLFGSGAAAAGAVLCWWQIRDVTWRVTPGLHSADDVLSAMPKHAFHAGETSWAMPKRHDSDSDEETEVITIN